MAIDNSMFTPMDQKVFDWISTHVGEVTEFDRHPRWRPGWDVLAVRDGQALPLYVRGPRGDTYVSPVDMVQETAIHRALGDNGIPVPRVYGMMDDPVAIVMERLPGRIDSGSIADTDMRQRIRDEYIGIVARVHSLPMDAFADVNLVAPETPSEIALSLYAKAESIFFKSVSRPFPAMRFIGQWLHRNVPADRSRATFVNYDSGQFLFDGDHVSGLIDFEVSCFGDPAAELSGLRIRNVAEPLGDITDLIERYEQLTGDRISKKLIEYHTVGFMGVNGFLMWPLAFASAPEQDYVAYMNYSVATTRFAIRAIADHMGTALAEPAEPALGALGFSQAATHLVQHIERMPAATPSDTYARDSGAALALYLSRWNDYGLDVRARDLAEASALVGRALDNWDDAQEAVDAFVIAASPDDDARLAQYFHSWLRRQEYLLRGCGQASFLVGMDLQEIRDR